MSLIPRSQICEVLLDRENIAQELIKEGIFGNDDVGRGEALFAASESLLKERVSASPEEVDPAFKDDLVFQAILTVLQESAGSTKAARSRQELDKLVDAMNDKGRLEFADTVVLRLLRAVKRVEDAKALGLNSGEFEALGAIEAEKALELRNWIFLQLAGKGPLYSERLVSRFARWGLIRAAFARRPKGENRLARRSDSDHWKKLEAAVAKPLKTDLELARDQTSVFGYLLPEAGPEQRVFIGLYWRRFTAVDLFVMLDSANRAVLEPAALELLEARQKELRFIDNEARVMAGMQNLANARIGTSLPRLEFREDYPVGKNVLNNLRLHGRAFTFNELQHLLEISYNFTVLKTALPDGLVAELVSRMGDLGKVEGLWREYRYHGRWKPSSNPKNLTKAYVERWKALEKERKTLVEIRERMRSEKAEFGRKSVEEVREELFAAEREFTGRLGEKALGSLLDRYEEIFSPYTTALAAEQMKEVFPLAIRKVIRIAMPSEFGWTWLMRILHDQATAAKLSPEEARAIKEAVADVIHREAAPLYDGDGRSTFRGIQSRVLEPYLERSWSVRTKPLEVTLQERIDEIDADIKKTRKKLADEDGLASYEARRDELRKQIDVLEAKLGDYVSTVK